MRIQPRVLGTCLIVLTGVVSEWRGFDPSAVIAQDVQGPADLIRIPDSPLLTQTGGETTDWLSTNATKAPEASPRLSSAVLPLLGVSKGEVENAVAAGTTIPMWSYATTSTRDNRSYSGVMVGASPFASPGSTTTIPVSLIAVKFQMADGGVFDPTAPNPCLGPPLTNSSPLTAIMQSPILANHGYTMNGTDVGVTQYGDAFQRANFWSVIGSQPYHTLLSTTTAFLFTITVASGAGATRPSGGCGNLGVVDANSFDAYIQSFLLPALAPYGVGPTTLPVFVFSNVVLCGQASLTGCGIGGYHSAVGSPPQTYMVADFDTTGAFGVSALDTAILSHEVAEWLDDPLGTNSTPSWGGIGQVQGGCQGNLEVADPLTDSASPAVIMPNGYGYHLAELAFYSWFFGEPSLGAGGLFSTNGTLVRNALACPPGGSGSFPLPPVWQLVGSGDLDGDGKGDLIWRQARTGDVAVWLMSGAGVSREPTVAVGVPLAWQIVGIGDLDGDGRTDVVWRQTQTGDVAVWLMNGSTVVQSPVIAAGVPLTWQIVGIGDLDGDSRADLVWRNTQSGDVAAWLMNGAAVRQGPVIAPGVALAWQIVGVRDLDGDGRADLVWRQMQTGDVAAWLMNGVTVTQGPVIGAGVPLAWQIVAVRDLNGDGKADLVWRNTQSGDVAAWLMDGVTVTQGPVVSAGVPLVWQIAGIGDLDGDGLGDLIWRQTQTGDVATWLMNGATVKQAPTVNPSLLPHSLQ